MRLSVTDAARVAVLKGRNQILLYLAAIARADWSTTNELASIVGVPARRAALEVAKLVEEGWFERKSSGKRNGSLVRVRPGVQSDQSDRSKAIKVIAFKPIKVIAFSTRSDPDLSLKTGSMDQRVRPSGEVQEGTDGRTDVGEGLAEHRNELTERVCREWARWAVTPPVAYRGIDRLLNARLTERELEKFLVDALNGKHPAFAGVQEHMRWGQSTSDERIKLWCNIERATRDVGLARPRRVRDEREAELTREERAAAAAQAEERFKQLTRRR